jgi:hypothetical protein
VGDFYAWRCVKRDTKLRIASHVGKYDQADVKALFEKVKSRILIEDKPMLVSDGGKPISKAILPAFGTAISEPVHRGPRWKYPRFDPPRHLLYAQAIKHKDAKGRLLRIEEKVIYGAYLDVFGRIDPGGVGRHISTFCVERDNLTLRLHDSRLVRKTLCFSKELKLLEAQVALDDAYYNFCLSHLSLRELIGQPLPTKGSGSCKRWRQRTPAMAEGLADHIWTIEELLGFRVPPKKLTATSRSP